VAVVAGGRGRVAFACCCELQQERRKSTAQSKNKVFWPMAARLRRVLEKRGFNGIRFCGFSQTCKRAARRGFFIEMPSFCL
jgi:hypothetical protein